MSEMGPDSAKVKNIAAKAVFLVVDVQERLAPAIPAAPEVVPRIAALIEKAREVGLPILASEQYSRGLGPTLPALRRRLAAAEVIEKIYFAAPREADFAAAIEAGSFQRVFVAGMEAHVCVQQTVLALLARGFAVIVIDDAVASRDDLDRRVALVRLARAGATIAGTEAVLAALGAGAAALSP